MPSVKASDYIDDLLKSGALQQAARNDAAISALAMDGKGSVKIIDLGPAEPIDAAVKNVRETLLRSAVKIRDQGEPDSLKEIDKPLHHERFPVIAV